MMNVGCNDSSITMTVGTGATNQYVYNTGYFASGSWNPVTYQGTLVPNANGMWLTGNVTATFQVPANELTDQHYALAYTCTWTGTQWKCGCRDSACTTPSWQIQSFQPR